MARRIVGNGAVAEPRRSPVLDLPEALLSPHGIERFDEWKPEEPVIACRWL
jgi:hypothetical protein